MSARVRACAYLQKTPVGRRLYLYLYIYRGRDPYISSDGFIASNAPPVSRHTHIYIKAIAELIVLTSRSLFRPPSRPVQATPCRTSRLGRTDNARRRRGLTDGRTDRPAQAPRCRDPTARVNSIYSAKTGPTIVRTCRSLDMRPSTYE